MRQSARHFLLSILALVLSLPLMAGCGSDEEDIAAPAITLNSLQEHNDNRTGTPAFKVAGGELPLDGSVEPGALVEVEVNAGEPVAASVSGDFWSYTLDVATLDEGGNTIVISAEDSVGNKRSLTFFVTK
ncbi:MAG: hypothetical protein GWN87_05615, partial [Desulfuromonadales bacterium]|nr:hypothetical protein [Desulfuromonadales bacterium]NIS40069.1 hypothetical protein [Desulfuromonadales bacterium]